MGLGLGLNFNFFIIFPTQFAFYIGNLVLGGNFTLVILGGTKRGKIRLKRQLFVKQKEGVGNLQVGLVISMVSEHRWNLSCD